MEGDLYHLSTFEMFIPAFKNARENPSSRYVVTELYMSRKIKSKGRFEKEK